MSAIGETWDCRAFRSMATDCGGNGRCNSRFPARPPIPTADGKRKLLCTHSRGTIVLFNAEGKPAGEVVVPNRFVAVVFGADLKGDNKKSYCAWELRRREQTRRWGFRSMGSNYGTIRCLAVFRDARWRTLRRATLPATARSNGYWPAPMVRCTFSRPTASRSINLIRARG